MPKPVAPKISLPARCRKMLQSWTQQYTQASHRRQRAQILLLADQELSNTRIAEKLNLNRNTVRKWRDRFVEAQDYFEELVAQNVPQPELRVALEELLDDAPRPGAPPTFEPEQVVRIVRLACKDPEDVGVPLSHWTPDALAEQAVEEGIVESISPSSVRRFLKSGRSEASP